MSDAPTISSRVPGLSLHTDLTARGEEMYLSGPDPQKPKQSGRGKSNLESALTYLSTLATDPIQGLYRTATAYTQNDKVRSDKIKQLAGSQDFLDSYDKDSNTYGSLDWITRNLYNIKADDVTSQRIRTRQSDLENSPGYRALKTEFRNSDPGLTKLFPKGALTSLEDVSAAASDLNTRTELLKALNDQTMGPGLLATKRAEVGGRRLTNDELRQLQSVATVKDPVYIENRDAAKDKGRLVDQEIQASKDNTRINQDTLSLAQTKERNANTLANSEIAFGNRKLDYEWRNANADRDYQWRSDEADREQRKVLTMLGLEDKGDARRERSEERAAEQRQLFILQLMKGLGSLGNAVSY